MTITRTYLFDIRFSRQGVGPTVLGGKILASLALDDADEWSKCELVRNDVDKFSVEPFRYVGSTLVREALRRKDDLEDCARRTNSLTVAMLAPEGYMPCVAEITEQDIVRAFAYRRVR
ncbi:hypothetical protein ABIF97_004056 [Bradyrhizobium japonicum]